MSLRGRPRPRLPGSAPHAGSAPQVTLGLFGLRGAQAERGPRAFAALAECCKPFEPGQRYQEFVRALGPYPPPPPPAAYSFQEFTHRWVPRSRVGWEARETRHQAFGWGCPSRGRAGNTALGAMMPMGIRACRPKSLKLGLKRDARGDVNPRPAS